MVCVAPFVIIFEPTANNRKGAFGVFGYTGKGVVKSLHTALHQKTMKAILEAKRAEAEYLARGDHASASKEVNVVEAFRQATVADYDKADASSSRVRSTELPS